MRGAEQQCPGLFWGVDTARGKIVLLPQNSLTLAREPRVLLVQTPGQPPVRACVYPGLRSRIPIPLWNGERQRQHLLSAEGAENGTTATATSFNPRRATKGREERQQLLSREGHRERRGKGARGGEAPRGGNTGDRRGAGENGCEFQVISGALHWVLQPDSPDNPQSGLHPGARFSCHHHSLWV